MSSLTFFLCAIMGAGAILGAYLLNDRRKKAGQKRAMAKSPVHDTGEKREASPQLGHWWQRALRLKRNVPPNETTPALAAQTANGENQDEGKDKKQEPPPRVEKYYKDRDPNAEIVIPARRTIGLYRVDLEPNKEYGRTYLIGGRWLFSLRLNPETQKLEPMPHVSTMEHPPSEIYEALQTKDDTIETLGDHDDTDKKLKMGLLVLAACIALFLMFMAVYRGGSSSYRTSIVWGMPCCMNYWKAMKGGEC